MTIAMAFKCKDGAVVAADKQGTQSRMLVTEITKVHQISKKAVMALSFEDSHWASRFVRFAKEPSTKPEDERIDDALHKYREYVRQEYPEGHPDRSDLLSGVLAMLDPTEQNHLNSRVFDFTSEGPVREEPEHGRVLTGTGFRRAEPLLRVAEFGLGMLYGDLLEEEKWKHLNTMTVAKLAYLLLITLPSQEGYVHGATVFEIRDGVKRLKIHYDLLSDKRGPLESIIESFKNDVRPSQVVNLTRRLSLIPHRLNDLVDLDALEKKLQSWD